MNKLLSIIVLAFILTITFMLQPVKNVQADEKSITVGGYLKLLMRELSSEDYKEINDYLQAAKMKGIIKDNDRFDSKKAITVEECAVISNRAEHYLSGKEVDSYLMDQIKSKNRITDINNVSNKYRQDVMEVYAKGIIIGEPNGLYSHDRVLHVEREITEQVALDIVERIIDKSKRSMLTNDGQVIRVTNLPNNAKEYPYILDSFPNEFYEMNFRYESATSNKRFEEYRDFCIPKRINIMLNKLKNEFEEDRITTTRIVDNWTECIEQNLKARFNFNYSKVGQTWIDTMAKTYSTRFNETELVKLTYSLSAYVTAAKNNCVIIKADKISVEPSTLYYSMGCYYIRCYVKFMVSSCNNLEDTILYCTDNKVYLKDLNKVEWHEAYYDIAIGTKDTTCLALEYGIYNECISDYLMKIKDHPLHISFGPDKRRFFRDGNYYWS